MASGAERYGDSSKLRILLDGSSTMASKILWVLGNPTRSANLPFAIVGAGSACTAKMQKFLGLEGFIILRACFQIAKSSSLHLLQLKPRFVDRCKPSAHVLGILHGTCLEAWRCHKELQYMTPAAATSLPLKGDEVLPHTACHASQKQDALTQPFTGEILRQEAMQPADPTARWKSRKRKRKLPYTAVANFISNTSGEANEAFDQKLA